MRIFSPKRYVSSVDRIDLDTLWADGKRAIPVSYTHLQPDATGFFKNPFARDDDSGSDDDTKTGIDGSMDDSDSK